MTLLDMKDKRALLQEDNLVFAQKLEKEKRKATPEEEKEVAERKAQIESLERAIEIEEEKRKFDPASIAIHIPEKKEKPSLFKAVRNIVNGKDIPEEFRSVQEQGEKEMSASKIGCRSTGQIVIPSAVDENFAEKRAAIVTGQTTGTTAGGYAIQTDKLNVLPPLTNYLVLTQAGASYLPGLVGNVSIPTYSGTTVLWQGETASATDGAGTWGKVDLNPKRLTAFIDVSKMFLLQDSVGAEQMLRNNIAAAIAVKLESTILGVGAGSVSTEPAGLFAAGRTTAPVAASWDNAVDLMKNVDINNALTGNLSYISHPAVRAKYMKTAKVSSSDSNMVSNDGKELLGYPLHITNSVAYMTFTTTDSAGLIFGNWGDLLIGQWGGYDLTVDPYTQAALGTIRLVVNCYFDAAAARSVSFSVANIRF
jgi:HK97 family phage major capsid protein